MSPPCESYLARRPARPAARRSTRCTCGSATSCLLVQLPAYIAAEDIFSRLRVLLVVQRLVGGARPPVRRGRRRRGSASAPTRSWSRWPATTATCCSTSSARGIRCLGIEPAAQRRRGGPRQGHPDRGAFLGEETGDEVAAPSTARPTWWSRNNVFAHVPGHRRLRPGTAGLVGEATAWSSIEIPHLLRLIEGRQYDTIYHEHYSYLSLLTTQRCWRRPG